MYVFGFSIHMSLAFSLYILLGGLKQLTHVVGALFARSARFVVCVSLLPLGNETSRLRCVNVDSKLRCSDISFFVVSSCVLVSLFRRFSLLRRFNAVSCFVVCTLFLVSLSGRWLIPWKWLADTWLRCFNVVCCFVVLALLARFVVSKMFANLIASTLFVASLFQCCSLISLFR